MVIEFHILLALISILVAIFIGLIQCNFVIFNLVAVSFKGLDVVPKLLLIQFFGNDYMLFFVILIYFRLTTLCYDLFFLCTSHSSH